MEQFESPSPRTPSKFLPPPDMWLYNPEKEGRLPTPLDERGLVDPDALITLVSSTVDPSYRWPSPFNDVHHLQWPHANYHQHEDINFNPQVFRNLSVSKLYVPRIFHNWTHKITEPPPVPHPEVMRYRIEAQRVALALFQAIRASKRTLRLKMLDDNELETRLITQFETFNQAVEDGLRIPEEFRLVDLSDYHGESIEEMFHLAPQVGKLAVTSSAVRLVTQNNIAA